MPDPLPPPRVRDVYAHWARDTIRFADTDLQGHVNNAAFATFFESGRVHLFRGDAGQLAAEGFGFAIVRLVIEFRREMRWPGAVDIGTGVARVGRTSFSLQQALFVEDDCMATAESVVVLLDTESRRAAPVPDALRAALLRHGLRPGTAGLADAGRAAP